MKRFLYAIVILQCCLLSGCFSCLSSWCLGEEAYERLMHPKGFGEYWEKPDTKSDIWRADWVKCGGMVDGGHSTDEPPRSSTAVILAASKKKRLELGSCMRNKGYNITREWD